ncbi:MAG: tRNA (adenosine(37)-N6)-threonylcarbamoyltransferase complex dimerization subunit type 1 TsaB [Nitrospinae bacterium RIFCSPLOWO2_01_FULL_39_10]|nr:MAG: tRNA (adenosine(37)-N6)-threonylcarbamoyltransferase complex dimerization subunit type 1 TsaB [Nitrospinae bacterium RIFCSPLOWO2_01_FULL_39_10]
MIVFGIDTSTNHGSVAIAEGGSLLSESFLPLNSSYSKTLINSLDDLLKKCKLGINDIDGFAVSIGPGSFTGLRIGLSTCKGFNLATGKPIIPVGTLDAIVESYFSDSGVFQSSIFNIQSPILLCPILDAKKGEVYASIYKYEEGKIKKVADDMAINPEKLCQKFNEPAIFFGEGIKTYGDFIKNKLNGFAYFYNNMPKNSVASSIALLGGKKLERGDIEDSTALKPRYIRRSEAEIKLDSSLRSE